MPLNRDVSIPRLVIAGCASGVGKTTATVALTRAWMQKGLRVRVFKCGPDYLDPTYHVRASGDGVASLDGWMMGESGVVSTFTRLCEGYDVAIIEGMMGLFDGTSSDSNAGSTAEIAKWLQSPIVMVIDASAMARTAYAVFRGLQLFAPDLNICGLIANNLGSTSHLDLIRLACGRSCLGGFVRAAGPAFPSRHLGLKSAAYASLGDEHFASWGQIATKSLDLAAIQAIARAAPSFCVEANTYRSMRKTRVDSEYRVRIAIANDEAFHFYYDENLELLRQAGAILIEFSPLHDRSLPECEGVYIGGGYPEVYAEVLAANTSMRASIVAHVANRRPLYAECGGMMALTQKMTLIDGSSWPMWGVLPGNVVMHDSLQALGYVEVTTREHSILGPARTSFRGHQFRYSTYEAPEPDNGKSNLYDMEVRRTRATLGEGFRYGENVVGSYVHAHWASNPAIPQAFVRACVVAKHAISGDADR